MKRMIGNDQAVQVDQNVTGIGKIVPDSVVKGSYTEKQTSDFAESI